MAGEVPHKGCTGIEVVVFFQILFWIHISGALRWQYGHLVVWFQG